MKFSEKWLLEWANPGLLTTQLSTQLTNLGLEVDSVVPAAGEFTHIVVGEIISAEKHPDADRLRCCQVSVGESQPLSIVCGGVNARAGIKVAVATVGASLPGGLKIKRTKLRGQPSCGMICSSAELGLGPNLSPEHGIMELPLDAEVGMDFREFYDLNDSVIDIELTPNRGDCASILGVAREVAVKNNLQLPHANIEFQEPTGKREIKVHLDAALDCPRYCSRVIENIDNTVLTPVWMQERLRRSGIRSINPVVDVMNYVMLELGQPMHAFDVGKLEGDVRVRYAFVDEEITLLDDQQITMDEQVLVIADENTALAMAGVMGGAYSGVQTDTTTVLLEAAYFSPLNIRRTVTQYNLRSDSSYRFERGVDFVLQSQAIERATQLLLDIVGGQAGPIQDTVSDEHLPAVGTVQLRYEQVERVLGVVLPENEIVTILTNLGFTLLNQTSPWHFRIPSYRFDIEQEIDLIEELSRVYGYQNIPTKKMLSPASMVSMSEAHMGIDVIKQVLVARGYHEAVTYSFIDAIWASYFQVEAPEALSLKNPISSDLSQMRFSLWPGLLSAMLYNQNRQLTRLRLFEIGRSFIVEDDSVEQPMKLAMLATGGNVPQQWQGRPQDISFFDLKAEAEVLLARTHREGEFEWRHADYPALHPGQSAVLMCQGETVGHLGRLHPQLTEKVGLNVAPILFEIDLDVLLSVSRPSFTLIPKFPFMRRDLAVVIQNEIDAQQVCDTVAQVGGEILNKVEIFDIYQGEGIDPGQKSVALGLTFQHPSRTLIDSEVDSVVTLIIDKLHSKYNATMRA